jgi:preprotein translocase subunit SecG
MFNTILTFLLFVSAFGIVALVLMQRGKGADAGAGFGSGASGTVFGARGARTALSRATAVLAAIFMITCLALTYLGTRKTEEPKSVLDTLAKPAEVAPATPAPAAPAPASPDSAGAGAAGTAPADPNQPGK